MFRLCSGNCFQCFCKFFIKYTDFCTAHRTLYIHFRNRPIQSISQQQSLEAHKRILPLPVVWLIPCGSYGQCLSQPFELTVKLTLYCLLKSDGFKITPPFRYEVKSMYPSFRTISVRQGVICCRIEKKIYKYENSLFAPIANRLL